MAIEKTGEIPSTLNKASLETKIAMSLDSAFFEIGDRTYELPLSLAMKDCGLASIISQKDYKNFPADLPRNKLTGAFVITDYRHPVPFGLMIDFLKGDNPLKFVPANDIVDAYIALESELAFWEINEAGKVQVPKVIWNNVSWSDGYCVYPMTKSESAAIDFIPPTSAFVPPNLLKLSQHENFIPESLNGYFTDTSEVQICEDEKVGTFALSKNCFVGKVPFSHFPVAAYGDFVLVNDNSGDTQKVYSRFFPAVLAAGPTELLVVWNIYTFFHIRKMKLESSNSFQILCHPYVFKNDKSSWICFHQLYGTLMTSHPGPIPHVISFDMADAAFVKFTPFGAIVIVKSVQISFTDTESDDVTGNTALIARIIRIGTDGRLEKPFSVFLSSEGIPLKTPDSKVLPMAETYEYKIDYDVVDRRLEDGKYEISLIMDGSLVTRLSDETTEDRAVFNVNYPFQSSTALKLYKKGLDPYQPGVTIRRGLPIDEAYCNLFTLATFDPATAKYMHSPCASKLYAFQNENRSTEGNLLGSTCAMQ